MSTTTTVSATVHVGPLSSIPSHASPGLMFLKSFLPILDSLDPSSHISPFCISSTTFRINRSSPVPVSKLEEMLQMRAQSVEMFKHDVKRAWDIPSGEGRTLVWESISVTRFKGDNLDVVVNEMNVWELVEIGEEWKLVSAECWMDPSVVSQRAKEVFGEKKAE